jgi:hypothetical protein
MDRSTRRMDEGKGETPSTPDFDEFFNPLSPKFLGLNAIPTGVPARSLGTHNLPVGAQERHPSSPFPPETGKRTLETGPSYER